MPTSAVHGLGFNNRLDEILKQIAEVHTDIPESDAELSIAIIGKPNVGKSSLLNAILGEQRVLVSAVPGTTRDSIDTNLQWHGHSVDIIDTAGLRKRGRILRGVEAFSVLRTMESIERSDVCLLVLDASQAISAQDTHIAGHAHKTSRGIVTLFNKWDLIRDKETKTAKRFAQDFRDAFSFIRYAPMEYLSALTHQRIHRVLEAAWKVHQSRDQKIPTSQLNRVLETAFRRNPPKFFGGGNGNVKYGVQVGQSPPRFAVYVNNPAFFDRNYIRYLNNQIRAAFPFPGTVLRIDLRATERPKKGGRAPKLPEDVARALAQKSNSPGKSSRRENSNPPEISNPPEVLE